MGPLNYDANFYAKTLVQKMFQLPLLFIVHAYLSNSDNPLFNACLDFDLDESKTIAKIKINCKVHSMPYLNMNV